MKFEEFKIGMFETISKIITEEDINNYADLSLDRNPVHLDEEYAKNTIFKGRIAHGMLSSGLISAILGTKLPGEGSIYLSQILKFVAPVRIGEMITAKCEIVDLIPDKKIIILKTICYNQDDKIVIDGEAKILKN